MGIDLSPYWRPPMFATAIIAVDAMVWEGADHGVPVTADLCHLAASTQPRGE